MIRSILSHSLSYRTKSLLKFDYMRFKARHWGNKSDYSQKQKLHLGCWNRKIENWLNVDVVDSDYDVDLACGALPFSSNHFNAIVSQHVIEHLELRHELLPLLIECKRVLKQGGQIWLSCPDMEKVCLRYVEDKGAVLFADKSIRVPGYTTNGAPIQQTINDLFHQNGEHKNLFDFELLEWALAKAGFKDIVRCQESSILVAFPEFPNRGDDLQSLYVCATK